MLENVLLGLSALRAPTVGHKQINFNYNYWFHVFLQNHMISIWFYCVKLEFKLAGGTERNKFLFPDRLSFTFINIALEVSSKTRACAASVLRQAQWLFHDPSARAQTRILLELRPNHRCQNLEARIGNQDLVARIWQLGPGGQDQVARMW